VGSIPPDPAGQGALARAWWGLVKFGFRLLYNELAFTYDPVSWLVSLGQWRDWQRCALPHLGVEPGARILELAHGTGTLTIALRTAGLRPVALDLSPAMGRMARGKLRRWGYRGSLLRGRAQRLPFASAQFGAVVSTFPTDFIVDPSTLAETYRVLEPGGRLVVVFGGLLTSGGVGGEALELAYRVTGQRGPWPIDVERRLRDAGFEPRLIQEDLPRSVVLLLVCDKPPKNNGSA
jgi:SAM-dependent methyltransferase